MPKTQTIKCINKDDRYDPYESITHVGGTNPSGSKWKITQDRAIQEIKDREWVYYVDVGQDRVKVIVATSRHGNEYLKTEADEEDENNLLSLLECP